MKITSTYKTECVAVGKLFGKVIGDAVVNEISFTGKAQ